MHALRRLTMMATLTLITIDRQPDITRSWTFTDAVPLLSPSIWVGHSRAAPRKPQNRPKRVTPILCCTYPHLLLFLTFKTRIPGCLDFL
ncbi:hypothetical protein AVEN_45013-1 [Araneus ventricosus]|uniref:Uncharacterized protein n=1 Tax=Araneus ventricosus TaxID=182803 RepID=A0A4Y2I792_ARAVE|nr:hypothetical protein AVEN_45013-1 [Araneus ventricosus]